MPFHLFSTFYAIFYDFTLLQPTFTFKFRNYRTKYIIQQLWHLFIIFSTRFLIFKPNVTKFRTIFNTIRLILILQIFFKPYSNLFRKFPEIIFSNDLKIICEKFGIRAISSYFDNFRAICWNFINDTTFRPNAGNLEPRQTSHHYVFRLTTQSHKRHEHATKSPNISPSCITIATVRV